jgi:hypothetical protein
LIISKIEQELEVNQELSLETESTFIPDGS